MPKIAYSEAQREKIREALVEAALHLFAEQGIQHTTVEQIYRQVGISRTFFYSFFPAKEDLVVQAFYRQQPLMLEYAQRLMADPALGWREGVGQFLHAVCYKSQGRFAIMSVEEQQALSRCLSGENRREFQRRRLKFLTRLLQLLGVDADPPTVELLGNLVFSAAILRKAIPDTLPFLFPEAADQTVEFHIEAILNFMESLRRQRQS